MPDANSSRSIPKVSCDKALADFSQTGGLWVSGYPFELPTLGTSSGLTTGGTGFPGSGSTLGSIPAVPAIVSNFGTPTLPGGAGVSSLLPGSPGSLAGIAPLPGAVGGLWGMGFTQQTVPQTLFAAGNTAGAAAGFTSETMVGAGGVFGWNNVAVVVPVTRSGVLVNYGFTGVSAGNPAEGGGVSGDDDEGDGDDADAVGLAAARPSAQPAADATPAGGSGATSGPNPTNDPLTSTMVPYSAAGNPTDHAFWAIAPIYPNLGYSLDTSGGDYGSSGNAFVAPTTPQPAAVPVASPNSDPLTGSDWRTGESMKPPSIPPAPTKVVTLSIAFTGDFKIDSAQVVQKVANDRQLTIRPGESWTTINQELDALISRGDMFGNVVFSGHTYLKTSPDLHGSPDTQEITLAALQDQTSDAYKFLKKLGKNMAPGAEIFLDHCSVAGLPNGLEFISLMAKITGHTVHAYTDIFAVTPHGHEWIASPDGSLKPGKDYGAYKGSLPYYLDPRPSHKKHKRRDKDDDMHQHILP